MATVATTYRALHQVQGALALRAPRMAAAGASDSGVLRALPNEDVHFFVKKFDNARVVREVDSAARVSCWKTIGGAFVAALLLIGLLIPSAYNLLAGYRLHQLKAEQLRLETDLATLELEEAQALSPERLAAVAQYQHFVDPGPASVVYLNPSDDGMVAQNANGKK